LVLIVVGAITCVYGMRHFGVILGVAGVLCLVFTYKLTVEINSDFLRFWFGPGIFLKRIALEQIAYCQPFKGIILGWGTHFTGDGLLYNVSGLKAVTIVLKSGKKLHIGTDEPHQLIEAVNSALHRPGGDIVVMWSEVKADYLKRVEKSLSAVRHPRSFEILADVGGHLERRFAELGSEQRTWDNFQKIITEMGPPSDYAELVGGGKSVAKTALLSKYTAILTLVLIAVAMGMIILPEILSAYRCYRPDMANRPFVNDPNLIGKWQSVDFVDDINDFEPDKKHWPGDLYLKQMFFFENGLTGGPWKWTKGQIIHPGDKTVAHYCIKEMAGSTYLLFEWMSGDVTIRGMKPKFYVLKKVSESLLQKANSQQTDKQVVEAAIETARSWLQLVDEGAYEQSWSQAAEYFRKSVSEEQWVKMVEPVRKPLGKVLSREVKNSTYTTQVPGAPDGKYVIIQFETSFENKRSAVETITPVLEPDGKWHVSGYYIK
jgi:hypothetical protein